MEYHFEGVLRWLCDFELGERTVYDNEKKDTDIDIEVKEKENTYSKDQMAETSIHLFQRCLMHQFNRIHFAY